jgi:NADPH:quinone reductase-like Zn-dependent oxidoreductase
MKAVVWTKYGSPDGLKLREVEKPVPKDNEVLIKIHATTVTMGDCELRTLTIPGLFRLPMRMFVGFKKPKRITILGMELAGEIQDVGKDVTKFNPSDKVFAATDFTLGGNAEYICLSDDSMIAKKPDNLSFEEATAVPIGGLQAYTFLRKANIKPGQKVLINGACGTIGTYAVQLAKYYRAEVTGVDSTDKIDILPSIGADHVIDYTKEDFTESNIKYDVIFDVTGKSPFSQCIRMLNDKGVFLIENLKASIIFGGIWTSITSNKKVIYSVDTENPEDLAFLKELIEKDKIKPVIDKRFPLEQTSEAHRYVESGQKKGNVVITIDHNRKTN